MGDYIVTRKADPAKWATIKKDYFTYIEHYREDTHEPK